MKNCRVGNIWTLMTNIDRLEWKSYNRKEWHTLKDRLTYVVSD